MLADRALALLDADAGGLAPGGDLRLPATWPSWPGWPRPTTPGYRRCAAPSSPDRADAASSTMAHGVFSWAARESGEGPARAAAVEPPVGVVATPAELGFAGPKTSRLCNF